MSSSTTLPMSAVNASGDIGFGRDGQAIFDQTAVSSRIAQIDAPTPKRAFEILTLVEAPQHPYAHIEAILPGPI